MALDKSFDQERKMEFETHAIIPTWNIDWPALALPEFCSASLWPVCFQLPVALMVTIFLLQQNF